MSSFERRACAEKYGLLGFVIAHFAPVDRQDLGRLFLRHGEEATPSKMPDTKQDVLDMLRDLAELTALDEADPQSFRVRAYESAAAAISVRGHRSRRAHREGAPADRRDRQGHGREDPRAARDGQGREARGAAPQASAERGRAAAHPGARTEGARQAAHRARRGVGRRPAPRARRAPRARSLRLRREIRGEAHARAPAPRRAGRGRAHADLGRAAAREADRRAHARGAGRIARRILRVAAALRGDGRRHRPRRGGERSGPGDGCARAR